MLMDEVLYDSLGELLGLIGTAVVSGVLTLFGALTERAGLQELQAGHSTIGAWEVAVGLLALYVGLYLVGYGEVWPRLRGDPAESS